MTRRAWRRIIASMLVAGGAIPADSQDTAALAPTVARHVLAIDTSRVRPFDRVFEITVLRGDSTQTIGQRRVTFAPASYSGSNAWLLVETRTGIVPAVDSLYMSPEMRPLHWSSALGVARMGFEFSGDSIFGAVTAPGSRRSFVLAGRPDLVVSTGMIEALVPLLPLSAQWTDSISVMTVDLASTTISTATLAVIGEEEVPADSVPPRPNWVVALRLETRNVLFWVDKENSDVRRVQQPLPSQLGALLDFHAMPNGGSRSPLHGT